MFNDRDLGILGAGALLAILCLFLPLSFTGKVVIGFLVLIGFMALALLRMGPDRVPLEVWLTRRFRYSMQTRQYVNQQNTTRKTEPIPPTQEQFQPEQSTVEPIYAAPSFKPSSSQSTVHPVHLAWDEIGVYPLLTAFLSVVGIYFIVWLANGGAEEISIWFIWR
jgi:hypothetical protein